MIQIALLVGIVILSLVFWMLKRVNFSVEVLKQKTPQKNPEDFVTMLYKETYDLSFLNGQPLLMLDASIDAAPNAEEFGQKTAETVLTYLRVPYHLVGCHYTPKNEPPKVLVNDIHGLDFFIPADLKQSKGAIKSLIAYECTRIYLAFQANTLAREVKERHLTDYATIFLGLGVIFLRHYEELADLLRHIEPEFSFFTNHDDLLFTMAVYLHQRELSMDKIKSNFSSYQFRILNRHYQELVKHPFKLMHMDAFDAILRCQRCFQMLRVPAGKKLLTTCTTCQAQFEVRV